MENEVENRARARSDLEQNISTRARSEIRKNTNFSPRVPPRLGEHELPRKFEQYEQEISNPEEIYLKSE